MENVQERRRLRRRINRHRRVSEVRSAVAIRQHDVDVVVWARALAPGVSAYARALVSRPVAFDVQGRAVALRLLRTELPQADGQAAFVDELEQLCQLQQRLSGCADVRVKLHTVVDDMCRKFHVDHVGLRVLCTFVGPGTQWLTEKDVDRTLIGSAEAHPLRPSGVVRHASTGDVLVMKGSAWVGNQGHGCVHRSPPLAGSGMTRLVAVVDDVRARR